MQLVFPHTSGALLAAFVVLIPLPWQIKSRNIATVSFSLWLFAVNIIYGVNAVVWNGNVNNPAPVYCDITSRVVLGASFALPLSALCVAARLEAVASTRWAMMTRSTVRRQMIFEGVMCFGIPLLLVALHSIVEDHRFDIVEDYGCQSSTYVSIPAVFVVWIPPLLFSLSALVLSGLALRHFFKNRFNFDAHLKHSDTPFDVGHWFRLVAMVVSEMTWSMTFSILAIRANAASGLKVYDSWSEVHANFSEVRTFYAVEFPPNFLRNFELLWWAMPVAAYILFLVLGTDDEIYKPYKQAFYWVRKTILRHEVQRSPSLKSFSIMRMSSPPPYPAAPTRSLTMDTVEADVKYDFSISNQESPKAMSNFASEDDKFMLSTLQYLESDTGRVARSLSMRQSQASIGSQYSQYSFAAGVDVNSPYSIAHPPRPLLKADTTKFYNVSTHKSFASAFPSHSSSAFVADPRFIPRSISPIVEGDDAYIPLQRVASSQPSMTTVDDVDHNLLSIPVMVVQPDQGRVYEGACAV